MSRSFTRRRFLGTCAGAAGAAVVGLPAMSHAAAKAPFAGFSIGVQSYSLRGYPTDEAIRHAKELGFEHIEFYSVHFDPASTRAQIREMKQKMGSAGLKMIGHGVNRFTADHEANRKLFTFAKRAGLRNLSADPTPDSFDSLDKLVAEFDVRIAIHNHGPTHHYSTVVDVLNAIKGHHPNIGACADLGHFIRSGEDPVRVIRSLGDRLYGVHLKDFDEPKDKAKGVILGRGILNVDETFQALRQVNFPADGCLSVEYEENMKDPIADLTECLAVAKESARRASA